MGYRECKYRTKILFGLTDEHRWTQIYTAALHLRVLEIEQQRQSESRGMEVAEALGQVNRGKAIYTFQFHDQAIFYHQVRQVFANDVSLVAHWVRNL